MAQSYPPNILSSLPYGVPFAGLDPVLAPPPYDTWLDAPAPAFPDPLFPVPNFQFYAPPAPSHEQLHHGGPQGTPFPPPQWPQEHAVPEHAHAHAHAHANANANANAGASGHAHSHARADNAVAGALDPVTGEFSPAVEHPRMRTAQACEKCRMRKAKCSGDHPACQRCRSRGLQCEYAPERKMRGPNRPKPHSASPRRPSAAAPPARERAATLPGVFGTSRARVDGQDAAGLGVPAPAPVPVRRAPPPGHLDLSMFVHAAGRVHASPPHSSGTSESGTGTAPVTPRSLLDAAAHELFPVADGAKGMLRARELVYPEPDELQLDGHGAR